MMISPTTSIPNATQTSEALLAPLRELLFNDPLAQQEGPEDLAERLSTAPWVVEAALEALKVEGVMLP